MHHKGSADTTLATVAAEGVAALLPELDTGLNGREVSAGKLFTNTAAVDFDGLIFQDGGLGVEVFGQARFGNFEGETSHIDSVKIRGENNVAILMDEIYLGEGALSVDVTRCGVFIFYFD